MEPATRLALEIAGRIGLNSSEIFQEIPKIKKFTAKLLELTVF